MNIIVALTIVYNKNEEVPPAAAERLHRHELYVSKCVDV